MGRHLCLGGGAGPAGDEPAGAARWGPSPQRQVADKEQPRGFGCTEAALLEPGVTELWRGAWRAGGCAPADEAWSSAEASGPLGLMFGPLFSGQSRLITV